MIYCRKYGLMLGLMVFTHFLTNHTENRKNNFRDMFVSLAYISRFIKNLSRIKWNRNRYIYKFAVVYIFMN